MSIQSAIDGFLNDESPSAIFIQGKWGVGKTHFWRNQISKNFADKPWLKRYSYVSLFGVNSLADLKISLGVATEEFDRDAEVEWRLKGSFLRVWWRVQKWLGDVLKFIPRVGNQASSLYSRATFYAVKNRVICLDDVERRGAALSLHDVLGLVSYLVEDRSCRVVVIMNSGQLSKDDQVVWIENKEKVFHGELTYAPTLRETIMLGLSLDKNELWYEAAALNLEKLGVRNIRIVQRTSRAIRLAVESVKDVEFEKETIEHISTVLPLLIYSAFGSGDGAPRLDVVLRVCKQHPVLASLLSKRDDLSEEDKAVEDVVRKYAIYLHTPLDEELVGMLLTGFPDIKKLSEAVREYQARAEVRRLQDKWSDAWRAYHDTLQDNRNEIIIAMRQAWPPVSQFEEIQNLQSLVELLRFLGESGLASEYITSWIEQRVPERLGEFDERLSNRRIHDREILEGLQAAQAKLNVAMTLEEAFNLWIEDPQLIRIDVVTVFAEASPEEIVGLLMNIRSKDLAMGIRKVIGMRGFSGANSQKAALNFQAALEKISKTSVLADRRIKSWTSGES